MFGAKLTLIVLTSQRLARIDLTGPRKRLRVEQTWSCPAIASSELAATVAIACRLGEPAVPKTNSLTPSAMRTRSVVVLSDDIWNDTLTLPLDVTVLLQPDELQQALALEAENFSGINAFQSKLAIRKIVDTSTKLLDVSSNFQAASSWWIAQIAQSDLASMATAAEVYGMKFVGATHALAAWHASATAAPLTLDRLHEPEQLKEFGEHWARALSKDGYQLLVQPESASARRPNLAWLQACAALLTAGACAGVAQLRSAQLQPVVAQLKQQQQTLTEFDTTAKKLRGAEVQLQQSLKKLPTPPKPRSQAVLIHKTAEPARVETANWLALLDALSTVTPEECWIDSWTANAGQPTLTGRGLTAQSIHELARHLEQALTGQGWRVCAPVIQPGESDLVEFELVLRRVTPATRDDKRLPEQGATPVSSPGDWQ